MTKATRIIPTYHTVSGHEYDCQCSFCRAARTTRENLTAASDFVLEDPMAGDTYRVLVIGPMSGEEDWNRPLFEAARAAYSRIHPQAIVTIPHEIDADAGFLPGTFQSDWSVSSTARAGYLRRTIRLLTHYDAVVTIPFWWDSKGATVEVLVAAALDLKFFHFTADDPDPEAHYVTEWENPTQAAAAALHRYANHLSDLHGGPSIIAHPSAFGPVAPNPQVKGDPRFHALLREMGELHDRKQADYGRETDPFANVRASADFGVPAWVGAMVRANDKMRRLQTYAQGSELANESARDSFMDLAVYALIGLILHDEDGRVEVDW